MLFQMILIVWAHIIGGVYEKSQIDGKKIIIAIVHPNAAAAPPSIRDPIRTKEYATTTRFQGKALIASNPMTLNNDITIHGIRISRKSCTFVLAIL
ncbi:unnamed protein product [Rotaria sp. Silwood1]|nr:unnamed protein product [Rotaria sp. Silwood1]